MGLVSRAVCISCNKFEAGGGKLEWFLRPDLTPPYQTGIDGHRLDQLVILGLGNPLMTICPCPLHAVSVRNCDLQPVDGPAGALPGDHEPHVPQRLAFSEHE